MYIFILKKYKCTHTSYAFNIFNQIKKILFAFQNKSQFNHNTNSSICHKCFYLIYGVYKYKIVSEIINTHTYARCVCVVLFKLTVLFWKVKRIFFYLIVLLN